MKSRQSFLAFVAAPLMLASTSKPSLALFNVRLGVPTSPCTVTAYYCTSVTYTEPNFGTVTTNVKPITILPRGGTPGLLNLLNSSVWASNGWTFQSAQSDSDLALPVIAYKPILQKSSSDSVGAQLYLYTQTTHVAPFVNQQPFRWIQRVVSNHPTYSSLGVTLQGPHGTQQDKIDIFQEQTNPTYVYLPDPSRKTFNPFYDTFQDANSSLFNDIPKRIDITQNHDWYAELYLVEERYPKQVIIYNGLSWGWTNTFTPPPPPPPSCNGSSGGGGCRSAMTSNIIAQNSSSSVPEPTSMLGLLAFVLWGALKGLPIRKNRE